MPSRERVLRLLAEGLDYQQIGARLGVSPGLAYLVATGHPADRSDRLTAEGPGQVPGSTQHLATQTAANPLEDPAVHRWLRQRARQDPGMAGADAKGAD
ncbi:MAG TPA: hypothetical protein VI138_03075 [Candidatus Dormibacteraeota bacterium]